jgi:hypothetical protein
VSPHRPRFAAFAAVLAAALALASASAQEQLVVVGPDPATVRLGDSTRAEIRIVDPKGTPRELALPQVDGLAIQAFGPARQLEQRWDGQSMVRRETISWQVELRPLREGSFVVPSFAAWTGSREQRVRELRLEARKDLLGEELGWIDVQAEPLRVYVHEPIRVRLQFGVQQGLRLVQGRANNGQGYYDVELQAGWLDAFPGGEPIATPAPSGNTALVVRGGNSLVQVAFEPDHQRAGGRWLCFTAERAFLPTRVGKLELTAPTLRFHVVRREGSRDLFGLQRGGQTEQYYAYGKPVAIEVLPIPEQGRPTPFFGAVGRFGVEAAIDRDSVQVGDSLKLTLTVRGKGNLEFLRLPAVDALDGFHKLGQAEARRDAEKVVVTYDLAPLSTAVTAVPPIAWNYFDTTPGVEAFVSTATTAIPLQVRPLPNGETLAPLRSEASKAVQPGVDDVFDLPALDGAPAVYAPPARWLAAVALVAPWLLAFGAAALLAARRRRAGDVLGQRARAARRNLDAALQAGEDPLAALAQYLGDRLGVAAAAIIAPDLRDRLRAAGLADDLAAAVVAAVEQGTAARFGGGAPLAADAVRALASRLEPQRLQRLGHALAPLLALALLAAGLGAQQKADAPPAAGDPVALYRAGDFRAAAAAFGERYAATGDRRLLRAQGNCWYRLGDLPRALWAYESALRALPRDAELRANANLVAARLQLDAGDEGLIAQVAALRARLTAGEQVLAAALLLALAAGCCAFGWRRVGLRWLALLAAGPGVWLALDALVVAPGRPPVAIALQQLALVSEPRAGLEPVATVRAGVRVDLLGGDAGSYVRVRAGDRVGFAPRAHVAVVE